MVLQLDSNHAWPSNAVLTVDYSLNGHSWSDLPSGTLTYNSLGIKDLVRVTGVAYMRLRITEVDGSDGEVVTPTVSVVSGCHR